jgi:uncharacterized membrane protein
VFEIGGYLFDTTGSYDQVWWWAAIIAAITALIHVYIDERPIKRIRANIETSLVGIFFFFFFS